MDKFREYINPYLGKLLEQLHMNKVFIRGEGHYLYDFENNRYLDFIAAYGALPFGFNSPDIWEALEEVRTGNQPSFIQPSSPAAAGELARRLIELAPGDLRYVTFTNSGAETVEVAIKMARSATRRMGILSTNNGFHGKTLGALSATGNEYYQKSFGAPIKGFKAIPYGDLSSLRKELDSNGADYAAFIVEPIQGEGGIVLPPAGYLDQALELCRHYGILFILDEIQTGLGRTGSLFACNHEGISPDILLLAKALGGGLYPIGACISTAKAYTMDFGLRHSSTFAASTLGCRIGLKVLDLLTRNDQALIRQIRSHGELLLNKLTQLQQRFPRVLKNIRGRGYMLGLEFDMSRSDFPNSLLSLLSDQGKLTPLISSYLLNSRGLRVAPTLNGNKVIRLEPPLTITWEECQLVLESIGETLKLLDTGNTVGIFSPLLDLDTKDIHPTTIMEDEHLLKRCQTSSDPRVGRFAFLIHPLDLDNYKQFDATLSCLPVEKLQQLADLGDQILEPFVIGETLIESRAGYRAYGEFITLPHTTKKLLELTPEEILQKLDMALKLAQDRGARLVGLGAYTSVLSRNGRLLQGRFMPLTTGNSFTVISGIEAIKLAAHRLSINLSKCTAAVIGATGSIGRTLAILLAEKIQRIVLVGNARHPQASSRRLRLVGADLCMYLAKLGKEGWIPAPGSLGEHLLRLNLPFSTQCQEDWLPAVEELERNGHLVITTDLGLSLSQSQVVITATSSIEELIKPQWVAPGAIICDISKPPNVRPSLGQIRPDVLIIDGGVVSVPGRPYMGWNFGFEPGLAYACMAETMMLALEHHYTDMGLGNHLSLDNLIYLKQLAEKHGFELAQLRSFDRPLCEEEWNKVVKARKKVILP